MLGTVPAGAQPLVGAVAAQASTAGPGLHLIAAQNRITLPRPGGFVSLDPGIYVASLGAPLQLDVRRASYTQPITITQVLRMSSGTKSRQLPGSVLDGFNGLRRFFSMRVTNSRGKTLFAQLMTFCPDSLDPERANQDGPQTSPYPQQCSPMAPFPVGEVWGIAKDWAVDPTEGVTTPELALSAGTYTVTESIAAQYRKLFGISARAATATVTVQVVNGNGPAVPQSLRPAGSTARPLSSAPDAPLMTDPPQSVLPEMVALPAWQIGLSQTAANRGHSATAAIIFAATVWIGGNGPLDVQGFRANGSPTMQAYQYFWRGGVVIGRAPVGTMGFYAQTPQSPWHFQQFAQYQLLNADQAVAVRSRKIGFCIAPTDGIDLTLPDAVWQVSTGLAGACGSQTALWVRETLPPGWGDTYIQALPGQSFDVTNLPNGTYYIEVIANPEGVLYETTTAHDVSLREIILGGTPGHRTIQVPAWNGLDPGGL